MNYVKVEERRDYVRGATRDPNRRYVLPISKLQGVANRVRLTLKAHRITTCEQLLAAAGHSQPRAALVQKTQLDPATLCRVVRRADMARINGIGVVFGRMLEDLGVEDVASLAGCGAVDLHERLRRFNQVERRSRRSPTPDEVVAWIAQARSLPVLVT